MILSRFYFGVLHVVCPLRAAQAAVTSITSRLTGVRRRKPIKAASHRGTYNDEPMGSSPMSAFAKKHVACDEMLR
ncbi:hypothetical protein KI688_004934 [Linnemannia hyalina]|uniref:Secreted protein n=1 Tax=Linnemannia hyalina TaxID=64524 RepID=A0A9P7XJX3_9FUNG|nr:hypothetical protein KI688_004934 [Linnemannia hyalina]